MVTQPAWTVLQPPDLGEAPELAVRLSGDPQDINPPKDSKRPLRVVDMDDRDLDEQLVEQLRPTARVLLIIARRKLAKENRDDQARRLAA